MTCPIVPDLLIHQLKCRDFQQSAFGLKEQASIYLKSLMGECSTDTIRERYERVIDKVVHLGALLAKEHESPAQGQKGA